MLGLGVLALVAAFFWLCLRQGGPRALSPERIYLLVWGIGIAFFLLKLLPYRTLDATTWIAIGGAAVAFTLGGWLGSGFGPGLGGRQRARDGLPLRRMAFWALAFGVLGAAGTVLYLLQVEKLFGLETLLSKPWAVRHALGDGRISSGYLFLSYFNIVNPIFLSGMWVASRERPPFWALALAGGSATLSALETGRTQFFWIVLSVVLMILLSRESRLTWKFALATVAPTGMVLLALFVASHIWLGKGDPKLMLDSPFARAATAPPENPPLAAVRRALVGPYLYLTAPFPALDYWAMEERKGLTWGARTVRPVWRLLNRLKLAGPPPSDIYAAVPTPFLYNTFTHLREFWSDFGFPGVLLAPLLLGAISGAAVERYRTGGEAVWLLVAGQLLVATAFSIFVNKWTNTGFLYVLAGCLLPFAVNALTRERRNSRARTTAA